MRWRENGCTHRSCRGTPMPSSNRKTTLSVAIFLPAAPDSWERPQGYTRTNVQRLFSSNGTSLSAHLLSSSYPLPPLLPASYYYLIFNRGIDNKKSFPSIIDPSRAEKRKKNTDGTIDQGGKKRRNDSWKRTRKRN